ncbi:MAG: hypothetical protein IJ179_04030 [Oscillospiraceae bacterium]|nr:hypothetical protein [Oscillospiraceae bacterium]
MNEVSRFIGRCGAGMASAGGSMKRSAANTKQDGKIVDAEKTIRTLTREIGNLTVLMLDGNRQVGPDIKERYLAIVEARKDIEQAEAEKVYTKVTCPVCGKKTAAGMHYCGHCGSLIVPEALAE